MGILLSTPKKEQDLDAMDDGQYLAYGSAAMQGWRTGMEDAHALVLRLEGDDSLPPKAFFAVYDGHGGFEVARFASRHVHSLLQESEKFKNGNIGEALVDAYIQTDEMMTTPDGLKELRAIHIAYSSNPMPTRASDVSPMMVGCTAVSCVVDMDKRVITCANSGDSRCVISEGGRELPLSEDHKPQLESEEKRITAAGGRIANGRVNGNLNLTRSLGDHEYKQNSSLKPSEQIITCVPDVKTHQITDDTDFILLGCDGIWDVMGNEQAVNFVRIHLLPQASLTEEEKQLDTKSNIERDAKLTEFCKTPATEEKPWPGDVATSLEDLLQRTASMLVDKCLAPDTHCIIGCDNMSACIILMRESTFGKRVIAALEERLKNTPAEPAEKTEEETKMNSTEEEKTKPESDAAEE